MSLCYRKMNWLVIVLAACLALIAVSSAVAQTRTLSVTSCPASKFFSVSPSDKYLANGGSAFKRLVYDITSPVTVVTVEALQTFGFDGWWLDGTRQPGYSTIISVPMNADHELEMRYVEPGCQVTISVTSLPNTGIPISLTYNGTSSSYNTNFSRSYQIEDGQIGLLAPSAASDGRPFTEWRKNGQYLTSGTAVPYFTPTDNVTYTAVYGNVTTFNLIINSEPLDGVIVTLSTPDINGMKDVLTSNANPVTRTFQQGAQVSLGAHCCPGSYSFQNWKRDGVDFSTANPLVVTADANHTFSAVYSTTQATSFGGKVTDASNGSPITGASVYWGTDNTTTNGSGDYSFATLPCGPGTLTVTKSGYQTSSEADYTPACPGPSTKNVSLIPISTQPPTAFCEHFDDGSWRTAWTTVAGGHSVVSSPTPHSSPYCLRTQAPPPPNPYSILESNGTQASQGAYSFWFYQTNDVGGAVFLQVDRPGDPTITRTNCYRMGFTARDGYAGGVIDFYKMGSDGSTTKLLAALSPPFVRNQWAHFSVKIQNSQNSNLITVNCESGTGTFTNTFTDAQPLLQSGYFCLLSHSTNYFDDVSYSPDPNGSGCGGGIVVNHDNPDFGGARCFNGVDDYVQVPNSASLNMTGGLTIEAWINMDELPAVPEYAIVSKWAGTGSSGGRYLFGVAGGTNSGKLLLNLEGGWAYSSQALQANQWHHVAVSFDGSRITFYIDGQWDSQTPVSSGFGSSSTPLAIGKNIHNNFDGAVGAYYFKGEIDEVRISNKARLPQEFCLAAPCGTDANTMGLWHLDNGLTADASGNNNNGTPNGSECGGQIAPKISLSAMSHDYGQVQLGSSSDWTIQIGNTGNTPLLISNVSTDNPDFSPIIPSNVDPGTTATGSIRFEPSASGAAIGEVTFTTNDPTRPQITLKLAGSGAEAGKPRVEIVLAHPLGDYTNAGGCFGEIPLNAEKTLGLWIWNTGDASLEVTAISSSNSSFSLSSISLPMKVMPGTFRSDVNVTFRPTLPQDYASTVTIASNDPNRPNITQDLTGSAFVGCTTPNLVCTTYPLNVGARQIAVADLDADGYKDIIAAEENQVSVLFNTHDGAFTQPEQMPICGAAAPCEPADPYGTCVWEVEYWMCCFDVPLLGLQCDGGFFSEEACRALGGQMTKLVEPHRETAFRASDCQLRRGSFTPNSSGLRPVACGDFTGDGKKDIAVGTDPYVSILRNLGLRSFLPFQGPSVSGSIINLVSFDFDRDRFMDLAVLSRYDGATKLRILRNLGDDTFATMKEILLAGNTDYISAVDLDDDGNEDLMFNGPKEIGVAFHRGSEFVVSISASEGDISTTNAVVADLDGNGTNDIVFANHDNSIANPKDQFHFLWNAFSFVNIYPGNPTTLSTFYQLSTSLACLDFDMDGKTDIAISSELDNSVAIFRNEGNGRFSQAWCANSVDAWRKQIVATDLNNDGRLDIVAPCGDHIAVTLNELPTPKSRVDIKMTCPTDLVVQSPKGLIYTGDGDPDAGVFLYAYDLDGDGELDNRLIINYPEVGVYPVRVIPKLGAAPTDRFSIVLETNYDTVWLARNTQITDIPPNGYLFTTLPYTSLSGQVQGDAGTGLYGVTLDISDSTGILWRSIVTDDSGYFCIDSIPNGRYAVTLNTPLGYQSDGETREITVHHVPVTVDFKLTKLDITPRQRSRAYWATQINKAMSTKPGDFTKAQFSKFGGLISQHFNDNEINPVANYVVPQPAAQADSIKVLSKLINFQCIEIGEPLLKRIARGELVALMLNVVAGKVSQTQIVTQDGMTLSQAITYCDMLVNDLDCPVGVVPAGYMSEYPRVIEILRYIKASFVAGFINVGVTLPAGTIPADIVNIAYKYQAENQELPDNFGLNQNYPNPFNPTTKIEFSLPTNSHVSIEIFNIMGQKVATLVNGPMEAGEHRLQWDGKVDNGGPVATGIYFYRLQAGDFVETKKMLLLK